MKTTDLGQGDSDGHALDTFTLHHDKKDTVRKCIPFNCFRKKNGTHM